MRVEPATALVGDLAVPAVKGICQRGVLLGAIAEGTTELRGFGHAADTDAAIRAVRALGVDVSEPDEDVVRIEGRGLRSLRPPDQPIDCENAGTVLRLLSGILAGQEGRFDLVGDASLSSRPVRVEEPLSRMGARFETTEGRLPATIVGAPLRAIRYPLPMASAQVKSSVLLAGLLAQDGPTIVEEPTPTRDHTERLLTSIGVPVRRRGSQVSVTPVERLNAFELDISGDFSSAAPFVVAATLLAGSELRVHGVNVNPTRIGLLGVLERMGANVAILNRRQVGGEPVGDLDIRSAELVATTIEGPEVPLLVDELPLFALLATYARGDSTVSGASELRAKETDRIETVVDGLRPLGARIRATEDGFVVRGVPARIRGGVIDAHGDHRIAMLGGIAGLLSREGVEVRGADVVAVSFPGFFDLLDSLRGPTS
ncbi:MAG TPA: 3-phosphoshikimate 1-carboxyvinyltransferase [Gaiellaceae bacterium]|nr:3-phosphoshikimate 1-carboxyvinyltransferase [Gaiellaceae bacterium]